jgi:hypothetical protein
MCFPLLASKVKTETSSEENLENKIDWPFVAEERKTRQENTRQQLPNQLYIVGS